MTLSHGIFQERVIEFCNQIRVCYQLAVDCWLNVRSQFDLPLDYNYHNLCPGSTHTDLLRTINQLGATKEKSLDSNKTFPSLEYL